MTNKDKENLAFDLYMYTDKTQKEICALVSVREATLSRWKKKGGWEEIKGAGELTAHRIITNLYKRLNELSEADRLEPDKIIKLASSIEKLSDRKVTVSNVINVFKEFTSWIYERDAELARIVNKHMKGFVDDKISGNA